MPSEQFEFPGQPDFELGSDRSYPVKMLVEFPDTKTADGLVFIIPGMGGEKDRHYSEMIRRHISAKHNLISVSVDAHCNTCRLQRSSEFGEVELTLLPSSIIDALGRFVSLGGVIDVPLQTHQDIMALLRRDTAQNYGVKATLAPPGGQYQNFGVLSALDHLAALHFLIDQKVSFNTNNIVCIGSSHGGYIAHMMHKFAPNTINGIIDASAYTETVTQFVDGKWTEYQIADGNILLECSTSQRWQFDKHGEMNFFGPDRALIRDTAYVPHVLETSKRAKRPCQFRMIHSAVDRVSPLDLKQRQAQILAANGFDVQLAIVREEDVDGKFIKSADHGMGIALNLLFDRYYPTLAQREGEIDRECETALTFVGPKMSYDFKYRRDQIHPMARCTQIEIQTGATDNTPRLVS